MLSFLSVKIFRIQNSRDDDMNLKVIEFQGIIHVICSPYLPFKS